MNSRLFVVKLLQVAFSNVHILAHCMGNRALLEALAGPRWNPMRNRHFQWRAVLKNVILAAADEKRSKFESMLSETHRQGAIHRPIISVYSSLRDRPLHVPGFVNWRYRLGDTRSLLRRHPMRVGDNIVDVIDTSGVRYDSFRRHSYYAEAHAVLDDIQNLLRNDHHAQCRVQNPQIHKLTHQCPSLPDWDLYAFEPAELSRRYSMQ
jgi:esterase/lipase superfamily enzyme